ncbi:sigma-54 dependent transcriptional regulator [Novosphingobium sp. Gsoil 351]|uniref:sigma-54-dependent transcriptional regulator n=1 Tax=Novosphingobium sp. Gsoil 351 TaxID=2675225 RepID=UPI0012B4796C|nr:sigma-54 dependent transcriptional regulator [Novosphingobium sp. Gsoil 351]QGN55695.1 response regulator [Novosphingobium sp. Gsoil 351]
MSESRGLVVFVDDDELLRVANSQSLSLAGFTVRTYADARSAIRDIDAQFDGVVVSDIRMPDMDGLQFFRAVREIDRDIPVVLITGHGDVPMAVSALKAGAHDFLTKPFAAEHLIATVRSACSLRALQLENRRLRQLADVVPSKSPLVGETPAIIRLRVLIDQIAAANVDAIIEGETGTGKELVARMIHRASRRRGNSFVSVACSTAAAGSLEGDMFGDHLPGQSRRRIGLIETAHRGTLYLDDVDGLPFSAQSRLMQLLDDGVLRGSNATSDLPVEIRIIASSKIELLQAVREGRFREDLYYRLEMARLTLPSLRERKADIPLLFANFVGDALPKGVASMPEITEVVRRHLIDHDWPGNARELQTYATRFVLGLLHSEDAGEQLETKASLSERTRRYEESLIRDVLTRCNGDVSIALAELKLPRKTFYDKLARHEIEIGRFRKKP